MVKLRNNSRRPFITAAIMVVLIMANLLVKRGDSRVWGQQLEKRLLWTRIHHQGLLQRSRRALFFTTSSLVPSSDHMLRPRISEDGSDRGVVSVKRYPFITSRIIGGFSGRGLHCSKRRLHATTTTAQDTPGTTSLLPKMFNRGPVKLLLHSNSRASTATTRSYFWLRGGASSEETVTATTDLSGKRPYAKTMLGGDGGNSGGYPVTVCSVQGWRDYMEDEFVVHTDFAACFDGHGGKAVSRYLRQNLYANLQAALPMVLGTRPVIVLQEDDDDDGKNSNSATAKGNAPCSNSSSHENDEAVVRIPQAVLAAEQQQQNDISNINMTAQLPKNAPTVSDYEAALEVALDKVDREVQRISHWSYQGSTAVACWIHSEEVKALPTTTATAVASSESADVEDIADALPKTDDDETSPPPPPRRTLITANVGDSRAILCRSGTAIELTRDHKPNDPVERGRIYKLGGKVVWHGDVDRHGEPLPGTGIWRVNGNLALSRAVGDRSERPAVTADPEISVVPLTEEDEFLVLATDGLWDVMSSSDTVAYIRALLENSEDDDMIERDTIAALVVEEALRRGSYDNITVIIVWMQQAVPTRQKKYWI